MGRGTWSRRPSAHAPIPQREEAKSDGSSGSVQVRISTRDEVIDHFGGRTYPRTSWNERFLQENLTSRGSDVVSPKPLQNGDEPCLEAFHELLRKLGEEHDRLAESFRKVSEERRVLAQRLSKATDSPQNGVKREKQAFDPTEDMLFKESPSPVYISLDEHHNLVSEDCVPEQPRRSKDPRTVSLSPLGIDVESAAESRSRIQTESEGGSVDHKEFVLSLDWDRKATVGKETTRSKRFGAQAEQDVFMPDHLDRQKGFFEKYLATNPASPRRMAWDWFGAFLIFYDLHIIPMGVFDIPDNIFTDTMDWVTLIFWTLNMFVSCCIGFVENGEVIYDPHLIVAKYIKSWFLIDLGMIVPDWVFVILRFANSDGSDNGSGKFVQMLRILRLVRMTRLVRLLKLRQAIDHIHDMINSEAIGIVFNIVKMIILLLIFNHLIGCFWFYLGTIESLSSTGDTWVKVHGFEGDSWGYAYLTSVHWAITQFTPASMAVQPWNSFERAYAIVVVVFALVGFSYIVGSITGSLTQLRSMHQDHYQQFWTLRRFMKANKVPQELASRIGKYLEYAWQNQRENISEKDVKIFKFLSEQLYSELQWEIVFPDLSIHPLFYSLKAYAVSMHRFANKALRRVRLVQGDSLFLRGELATNMYFVHRGTMVYSTSVMLGNDSVGSSTGPGSLLVTGGMSWISEPVLWVSDWSHTGNLKATEETDLILISPSKFKEVVVTSPSTYVLVQGYARRFVRWLNQDLSITDVVIANSVNQQIFYSMLSSTPR